MYTKQPKKLLILNILDILRKYSDANHRLSQRDIEELLQTKYDMPADRKAIRRNLMNLMDFGYDLEYTETPRKTPNSKTGELEETCAMSDFYLLREFTDSELRLLIDSLLFSKHIPYSQCKELIEKLKSLSSTYFCDRMQHIVGMPKDKTDNRQLFLNIELLDEAISRERKISFHYLEYGMDKQLHPKAMADGTVREYVISPYQIAAQEGRYYLICNHDKFDSTSNYRLDRITDVQILDEPVRPFETLKWSNGKPLDLAAYMREHPFMYSADSVRVTFRVRRALLSDVLDLFGSEVRLTEDGDGVIVSTLTDERSMQQFVKNYGPGVVILEPHSLRDRMKRYFEEALQEYQ